MNPSRAALAICGSVLLSGCAFESINGSGKIVTETRTVGGFSSVSLSGRGQLLIEQTGTESLTVTTDDNLLPYIKTEVRGNRLELGANNPITNLEPTKDIIFTLTVKQLDELDISGSGEAAAKGLKQDHLDIEISGSGEVTAQGSSDDLVLDISGSGTYRGEQLNTRRADVRISGSGGAVAAVSERLDADVSGSGSVAYIGNPQVNEHVSGSGSVRRR